MLILGERHRSLKGIRHFATPNASHCHPIEEIQTTFYEPYLQPIRVTIHRRLVAVKVGMGKDNTALSTEARILQHVRQTEGRGQEHIVQLLDLFTIKGPNGYHECFVTEVIVPLSAIDLKISKNVLPKRLNKQIALGLDYLHSQKIAHGGKREAYICVFDLLLMKRSVVQIRTTETLVLPCHISTNSTDLIL